MDGEVKGLRSMGTAGIKAILIKLQKLIRTIGNPSAHVCASAHTLSTIALCQAVESPRGVEKPVHNARQSVRNRPVFDTSSAH